MTALACVMTLVMQLFGTDLVRMFVSEKDVLEMGGRALRITSWFYGFLGIIYATRGVLNGTGDSVFALINGTVEIAGRIGLPLLLINLTTAGVWSIWLTTGITWLISGAGCLIRYYSWKRKNMIS